MLAPFKRTYNFINRHPLARRHLLLAYSKFLRWQIISFFYKGLVSLPYIENSRFLAKKRLTGITGNIYTGLHEFEDMSFLLHFLTPEDKFYDIGANVGSYTLLASGVKRSKTIAFEPIMDTYDILLKNVQHNGLERLVYAVNKGIGSKPGKEFFTCDEDTTNHVLAYGRPEQGLSIEMTTLDTYYPANKPALLKIDVEGFEYEVLKGAAKTLADRGLKAIIIELNGGGKRYETDDVDIHNILIDNAFTPYSYNPFNRQLSVKESYGTANTLYIRDLNFANSRLKKATPFKVFGEKI